MPESLVKLISIISMLPWIWEKSATKLAFFLLNSNQNYLNNFSKNIVDLKQNIKKCSNCYSLIDKNKDICDICSWNRNNNLICVVEEYYDMLVIEKSWIFDWVYHILWWAISPINWVFIWNLTFEKLFEKIKNSKSNLEIILATNPNIEWEATTQYILQEIQKRWFKKFVKITRLSRWLSNWYLEYADNITLINSIKERKEI